MRTRHRIIPLLSLTVLAWGTVSLGTISAACATNHRIISLINFPPEANPYAHPLYWAPEDAGQATFTVERRSHDCSSDAVTVDWAANTDTAAAGADYGPPTSGTTPGMFDPESPTGGPTSQSISIPFNDDGDDGAGVEQARIVLSNPTAGAVLGAVSQAPMLIVDVDGGTRVSFDPGPYAQSETHDQPGQATIPVFRAGPVGAPTTVDYSIGPGPNNPATPGADFTGNLTGTLTFGANDRVELISFTLANDTAAEQPEEVSISLSNPSTGTALDSPSTMTFTILDNEELNPPNSRFHHPRQGLKYKRKDYRIREVHVFTADDAGGSGVVGVEWAIRRNLKGGTCQWWTGRKAKFKKGDCQDEVWHAMDVYEPGAFYYDRLASLRPSIGTKIKSYTAFSRAIDGAQNVEQAFDPKRNMNRFEVKRK